jgi:hypothetical protein
LPKKEHKKKYSTLLTDITDPTGDIGLARDFLEYETEYNSKCYHSYSAVIETTNEHIARYEHLFENKKNMLGVIGSGEQIFSAVLAGIEDFEVFDISRFPKYFLYLKRAAIQGLTVEEYMKFFHDIVKVEKGSPNKSTYYYMYQDKIRPYLAKEAVPFWDFLLARYSIKKIRYEFYMPTYVNRKHQLKNNRFLQPEYYQELRDRLNDVRINIQTGDILDLAKSYKSEFDVVYLSNIHEYINFDELRYLVHTLNTTPEGVMLLAMILGYNGPYTCDLDLRHLNGQPYKFTRCDGYITGERRH